MKLAQSLHLNYNPYSLKFKLNLKYNLNIIFNIILYNNLN